MRRSASAQTDRGIGVYLKSDDRVRRLSAGVLRCVPTRFFDRILRLVLVELSRERLRDVDP